MTEPGDLVVDPFAGLHKVPIAAERLGRRWL
ncbi:site-specific DNA-methyltransferase, partial [Escherichia coli]|nr:site-specific DNA-methyltransferase [Escherichia coli]